MVNKLKNKNGVEVEESNVRGREVFDYWGDLGVGIGCSEVCRNRNMDGNWGN